MQLCYTNLFLFASCCVWFSASLLANRIDDKVSREQNAAMLRYQMMYPTESFEEWKVLHGKTYVPGSEEWHKRYAVWLENLHHVVDYNEKYDSHWLTMTSMADKLESEIKGTSLGFIRDISRPRQWSSVEVNEDILDVPVSVDWREENAVTNVKSQGKCGSCWAFAAAGAIEGANAIANDELVELSAQELLDCVSESRGCNGGTINQAFDWVLKNGGIDAGRDYRYTGIRHFLCNRWKTTHQRVQIAGYKNVPVGELELIKAVARQPVSAAIEADEKPFWLYGGGIFNGSCGTELSHGVLVVGYNLQERYFIVKNTWGTRWGEHGYIRMAMEGHGSIGKCGLASWASYPIAMPTATNTAKCSRYATCAENESCCCKRHIFHKCLWWGCCPHYKNPCGSDSKDCSGDYQKLASIAFENESKFHDPSNQRNGKEQDFIKKETVLVI